MKLYASILRARGLRQLQTPDLIRFPLRHSLEQVAQVRDRGRLADLNDLGHILTSMSELYAEGGTWGDARCHRHL